MTASGDSSSAPTASKPLARSAAYTVLAALVLIWGVNWPIMKLVVGAMPPLWFLVTRMSVGAICLFAFLIATRRLSLPTRVDWPVVVSVSVFQMWLFIGLITIGLQFIPAGRSAIISYSSPLWVLPAAVLLFGERLTRWKVLGMVLGLGGLIVLLNPASIDWSDRNVLLGNFLLLLSAGMYCVPVVSRGAGLRFDRVDTVAWRSVAVRPHRRRCFDTGRRGGDRNRRYETALSADQEA